MSRFSLTRNGGRSSLQNIMSFILGRWTASKIPVMVMTIFHHLHLLKLTLLSFYIFVVTVSRILLFWIVTQCSLRGAGRSSRLKLTPKMEAACSSKILVTTSMTALCH